MPLRKRMTSKKKYLWQNIKKEPDHPYPASDSFVNVCNEIPRDRLASCASSMDVNMCDSSSASSPDLSSSNAVAIRFNKSLPIRVDDCGAACETHFSFPPKQDTPIGRKEGDPHEDPNLSHIDVRLQERKRTVQVDLLATIETLRQMQLVGEHFEPTTAYHEKVGFREQVEKKHNQDHRPLAKVSSNTTDKIGNYKRAPKPETTIFYKGRRWRRVVPDTEDTVTHGCCSSLIPQPVPPKKERSELGERPRHLPRSIGISSPSSCPWKDGGLMTMNNFEQDILPPRRSLSPGTLTPSVLGSRSSSSIDMRSVLSLNPTKSSSVDEGDQPPLSSLRGLQKRKLLPPLKSPIQSAESSPELRVRRQLAKLALIPPISPRHERKLGDGWDGPRC